MKQLLIIIISALFCSCAHFDYTPDPWTKDEVTMQSLAIGLNVMDWGQTLDISDKPDEYYETNFILGEHPSRSEVNMYFASLIVSELLITHLLPTKYRKYWLGLNVGVAGSMVKNNYHVGLKVNF